MPKNGHLKLFQHIRRQKALRQGWLRAIVYDDDLMEHTRRQGLVDRPDGVQGIEALQRTARRQCHTVMSILQLKTCENMLKHVKTCEKNPYATIHVVVHFRKQQHSPHRHKATPQIFSKFLSLHLGSGENQVEDIERCSFLFEFHNVSHSLTVQNSIVKIEFPTR